MYVFAGGGTGGHLFPGIAVAQQLAERDREARFLFLGTDRPLEASILARYRLPHHPLALPAPATWRRHPIRLLKSLYSAVREAKKLFADVRPRIVIGLGGYPSVPGVLAARKLRIPILLLEQNLIPGRATRWLSRFAAAVCLPDAQASAGLSRHPKIFITGNPVRSEFAASTFFHRLPNSTPRLLILGGSQGAAGLNNLLLRAIQASPEPLRHWQITHQTGPHSVDTVRVGYRQLSLDANVTPFIDDLPAALAESDLVVTRGGATTLAELACIGVATIVVPYPQAAHDHQYHNAVWYTADGAGLTIREHDESRFLSAFQSLLADPGLRQRMAENLRKRARPAAASLVGDLIQQFCRSS